jgi:uncharacterized membrane protein YhiD involved in acid resistance
LVVPDISEREYRERAAGLRTHLLVGEGSALFTIISALLAVPEGKNARVRRIQLEEGGEEGREVRIEVRRPPGVRGRDLVDELQRLDEVTSVRWEE